MELLGSPQLAGLIENSPNTPHLKACVRHTKAEHSPKLSLMVEKKECCSSSWCDAKLDRMKPHLDLQLRKVEGTDR
ncbi:hypothetical protein E2C01_036651 [Portunus trituberculatus]|uniref:Uncharacterized protein n=1 Tax=Portunus trituberculatus TaxID=210409 RepID=A0A5B7FCJ1_PORTR|nr:hypothetical protein [Portunus trituberculatus]